MKVKHLALLSIFLTVSTVSQVVAATSNIDAESASQKENNAAYLSFFEEEENSNRKHMSFAQKNDLQNQIKNMPNIFDERAKNINNERLQLIHHLASTKSQQITLQEQIDEETTEIIESTQKLLTLSGEREKVRIELAQFAQKAILPDRVLRSMIQFAKTASPYVKGYGESFLF